MNNLRKPVSNEYPAAYAIYLEHLPETDIFTLLQSQAETVIHLMENLKEGETEKGYAEGKWSLKELLQHLLDTERIMAYRALSFSRKEHNMLPGFDEDHYVVVSDANQRTLGDLLQEYRLLRQSTIALFRSFSPEMLDRAGTANSAQVNVRSLIWLIAAHENHHLQIIRTRYLHQEIVL